MIERITRSPALLTLAFIASAVIGGLVFAAFQQLVPARVASGDRAAISRTLPDIWQRMTEAELEVPFADLYGRRLSSLRLEGEAGRLSLTLALLSPEFDTLTATLSPADDREAFLLGLARGTIDGLAPPDSLARAIAPAFTGHEPGPELAELIAQTRTGEAILTAIDKIERGVQGDLDGVTDGLALLRKIGMEKAARRTALELLLLERRG